ncbi:TPA: hypothetical protein N0F65_002269 [Lagenidium giganteum]|uniref:Uncharacterized protein n=1 Tax=Lagenidium giganteum TaxID=4803 RepID=A0AAV2YNG3_9STRA|nr:TPA: hypothetical protein N0F65_002269 [Lagenidium giganteum]
MELKWLHAREYAQWGDHAGANMGGKFDQHYGLSGGAAALVNESLVVIVGGRELPFEDFTQHARLDLFDLTNEKWLLHYDVKGGMQRRLGHTAVSVNGKAYVFGGEAVDGLTTSFLLETHEISFDENVLRCEPLSLQPEDQHHSPSGRAWHSTAVVRLPHGPEKAKHDAILVLGGREPQGKVLNDVWALVFEGTADPTSHPKPKWQQLTPTGTGPLPLAYHTSVAVDDGDKVLVFGGKANVNTPMHDGVFVLDLAANAWSSLPLHPSPAGELSWTARCGMSATALRIPMSKETGEIARLLEPLPQDLDNQSAVEMREHVVIFGGISDVASTSSPTSFALLDRTTGVITSVDAPNSGLKSYMGHAMATSPDFKSVFFFGGIDPHSNQYLETITSLQFWKPQPPLPGEFDVDKDGPNAIRTKNYDNGDRYVGEMDEAQLVRQGKGTCTCACGDEYEGEWKADKKDGQGLMRYADGRTYAGQWQDDVPHGYGILENSQVSGKTRQDAKYEGMWAAGERHGSGKLTYSDGSQVIGTWEHDRLNIHGRLENYNDGNGTCTYVGELVGGVPHGHGESQHALEVYVGNWQNGKRCGQGTQTLHDGTTYVGEWRNGKRNGFGTCDYARSRDHYNGKWVGGVRCGRGVCNFANGAQYNGEWQDDKCHGVGRYVFADGTVYEGAWKENQFCGDGTLVLNLNDEAERHSSFSEVGIKREK